MKSQGQQASSNLLARLQVMRGRIRWRLVVYGLLAVLAGGYAAFLTVLTFDWWLRFPGWLRVFVTALFSGGFMGSFYYWILRPLQAPLSLEALAGRLERHFPELRDRLVSTVSFLHDPTDASPALVDRLVSNTERIVSRTPLETALTVRPLTRSIVAFCVVSALMAGIVSSRPQWIQTGLQRYLDPFGPHRWPTRVEITPLSFDSVVPVGESAAVMMRITRGEHENLRGLLYMEDTAGRVSVQTMQRGSKGAFEATIDAISGDLRYWFVAGDDSTKDEPFSIRAVRRPIVLAARATIRPPAYASDSADVVRDFGDGPVSGTIGGVARIEIQASKAMRGDETAASTTDGEGYLEVSRADGSPRRVPLTIDLGRPDLLTAEIRIEGTIQFGVSLRDTDGFENIGDETMTLLAVPDQAPEVALQRPVGSLEMTPSGRVAVEGWIEDDFGLTDAWLDATVVRKEAQPVLMPTDGTSTNAEKIAVPLRDHWQVNARSHHGGEHRDINAQQVTVSPDGVRQVGIEFDWSLKEHAFQPGDVVTFSLVGVDNFSRPEQQDGNAAETVPSVWGDRQLGRSGNRRIIIISPTEFDTRLRDDVVQLERHLQRVLLTQRTLRDDTAGYQDVIRSADSMTTTEREQLASIGSRQSRVSKRLSELAERFEELASRMERASVSTDENVTGMRANAESLRNLAQAEAAEAADNVRKVYEGDDVGGVREQALDDALENQDIVSLEINRLIKKMSEWGSYRTLVTKARDMLQRQSDLRVQTQSAGKEMLGKTVDSLTLDEKARLGTLKRQQVQLGEELTQLMDGMKRLSSTEADKDPSGAEASEDALRAAKAHDAERHVKDAAEAVEQNRTAAATVAQKRVERALRKTLAALEKRETRELLRLQKKSREARELIEQLLQDQRALRDATNEAALMSASPDETDELVNEQRRLHGNANSVAITLARTDALQDAARAMAAIDDPMRRATSAFVDQLLDAAVVAQDEALAVLEEVLQLLLAVEEEAEKEVFRQTIDQIRDELTMLSSSQAALNDRLAKLVTSVEKRGRVSRTDAREATRIGRAEKDLQIALEELLPELGSAEVYQWALERVRTWMAEIHGDLSKRDVRYEIVRKGERIVQRLDQLIAAIDQTLQLPDQREFDNGESGGSSGQGGAGQKPGAALPPVTELLLIKSLQLDINARTQTLYQDLDGNEIAETQLSELGEIASDQEDLRTLAEKITNRAKGNQP
ncbi:MAG: hypothetical protein ACPGXK_02585 [Phycisphaerae bacterium]